MIDIQLYRARRDVFKNIYGDRLERSKGNRGCPSHMNGGIKKIFLVTSLAIVFIIILNIFKVDLSKIA